MTTNDTIPLLRPKQPLGPRLFRIGMTVAILVPTLWGALGLNVSLDRVLGAPADEWDTTAIMDIGK